MDESVLKEMWHGEPLLHDGLTVYQWGVTDGIPDNWTYTTGLDCKTAPLDEESK